MTPEELKKSLGLGIEAMSKMSLAFCDFGNAAYSLVEFTKIIQKSKQLTFTNLLEQKLSLI